MLQRIRDLPDQGLYGVIGVLAVVALYVIGFVIKNSKNVSVDFVLFSAGVPLITLMVVMVLFGALLGVALTLVLARRRTPSTAAPHGTVHAAAPPPAETPVTPPPPPPGTSV
ncbi:MAG: LapA family protein [Actinomycetota bacterium]|nr:LapA family protein [Actinomycetota bacterium]